MIAHSSRSERRRTWTEDRLTGRLPCPVTHQTIRVSGPHWQGGKFTSVHAGSRRSIAKPVRLRACASSARGATNRRECPYLSAAANFHSSEMIVKTALKKAAQKPAAHSV